jgi:hypothetical protein
MGRVVPIFTVAMFIVRACSFARRDMSDPVGARFRKPEVAI